MKIKKAIITGATGAIGTALTEELINNGIEVLVFTRSDSKRNNNIIKNKLVKTRYCSLQELSYLKNDKDEEYDAFFHLAWAGASGPGRNDKELQNRNIKYALDAVRCAKIFNCKKFVGIGSQAEYGRVYEMLKSDTPCNPENEYGKAKLEAGIKTRELAHTLKMEHNWVRVLSVYGPNDGNKSLISYTINSLKKHEVPEFTKGEQVWDYLYSEDAALAIRLIAEKGIDGKTYVLGSGKTKFLKEYIIEIRDIIYPDIELEFGTIPYSEKQVMYLKADISEVTKDTGWKPKTPFAVGIKKILNIHK